MEGAKDEENGLVYWACYFWVVSISLLVIFTVTERMLIVGIISIHAQHQVVLVRRLFLRRHHHFRPQLVKLCFLCVYVTFRYLPMNGTLRMGPTRCIFLYGILRTRFLERPRHPWELMEVIQPRQWLVTRERNAPSYSQPKSGEPRM